MFFNNQSDIDKKIIDGLRKEVGELRKERDELIRSMQGWRVYGMGKAQEVIHLSNVCRKNNKKIKRMKELPCMKMGIISADLKRHLTQDEKEELKLYGKLDSEELG